MKKLALSICVLWLLANSAAAQKSVATVPFEFYGNLIYIKVSVNGSRPLWFDLDSGASGCVVDKTVAKNLRLKTEGKSAGTGAGKGTYEITYTKNVKYGISGVTLPVESSYVIDLSSNIKIMGRPLDGLLGYDFFKRYVVLIDYDAQVLRLYEPQDFNYSGDGEIVPIKLKPKTPFFTGRLKVAGRDAADREFLIDSGSGDAVDDDLIGESTAPKLEIVGGVGLGQEFKTFAGPVEWLKIGKFSIENTSGATGGHALIGGDVLHHFTVILDYSRNQMILEPSRHYRESFDQNSSGADLRFDPATKGFEVHSVRKDSPADEAGLKEGDLITAVDGQISSSFTLDQMWKLMSRAGEQFQLTILRQGKTFRTDIKLRKPF